MGFAVIAALSDFYPRPPRGGRRQYIRRLRSGNGISIHALREEGDSKPFLLPSLSSMISIHALREEGDGCCPRC